MFRTAAKIIAAASLAAILSGCASVTSPFKLPPGRDGVAMHGSSYPADVSATLALKGMKRSSPILVRIFKEDRQLEVWKMTSAGRYEILKTYPICTFSGTLGPKRREGDGQAPEGFYSVSKGQLNPNSRHKFAFNLGFPNAFDRANGRSGMFLMVHGGCSSVGCYAVGDDQITEIYGLASDALKGVQDTFQVQAFPFRMTDVNMMRYAGNPNMPFWRTLKQGSDIFERTGREPAVAVQGLEYRFR
jgi:murein L,D-transpeptidase YafK